MTLNDYRKQFKRNLMIIRTANGTSDASAGRTEDASDPVYENVDYAIVFLFNNRRRNFNTAEELEELVLELVRITNNGIISGQGLFGSGADSIRFHYVRSQDIAAFWYWFTRGLYWMLRSQYMEVEEIAAFCEYVINSTGYFFSDGCSIVSMLMSTYVFMRFDLPCPEYTSGEEYKAAAAREKIPTVSDLHRLAADSEFRRFVSYYLKICPSRKIGYNSFVERAGDGSYICKLTGQLTGERNRDFRQNIEAFYEEHSDACVIFDCRTLAWIDMEGIRILTDLKDQQKRNKIPAGVPSGIETGNKTGELDNVDNDAAIIWSPGATYILVIMSSDTSGRISEIRKLSSMIYESINDRQETGEP